MGENYFLRQGEFIELLRLLTSDYDIFTLARQNGSLVYQRFSPPESEVVIGGVRAVDPLKSFFFPARELVSLGFSPEAGSNGRRPRCIVGAKSCDLKALAMLDQVFLPNSGHSDPFYLAARNQTLLISADCTKVLGTCFCSAFGLEPHCDEGADINLTELEEGVLLTVLSARGKEALSAHAFRSPPASAEDLEERALRRKATLQAVQENIDREGIPSETDLDGAVDRNFDDPVWEEEAERCVECGACNTICPTCHCFLLFDQIQDQQLARYKTWDSCLLHDFARVAGGHNPRPKLFSRLRNRFVKKFSFFPKVAGMNACTGCGRCIEACPAQIDIRRILKRIVSHADRTQPVSPN
jgi:ferredoxin